MTLDERRVGHLEGDGHGDQLISAAKYRKKRSMFTRLEESMAAAVYLLEKRNASDTYSEHHTDANYETDENTTYFYPAYTYTSSTYSNTHGPGTKHLPMQVDLRLCHRW